MRFALGGIAVVFLALSAEQPVNGPIRFEEVSAQAGIQFTHSFGAQKLGSLVESTGAGAVWFDFNNDGLMDLYVVSGKPLGKGMHPYPLRNLPQPAPHNHLFRNEGHGRFTDVTEQAGVGGDLFSMAAIAADYDNDGYVDLLVTGYGRVILYRNKGDGTFEDVTEKAGIKVPGWSIGSTWLDYDRDGCVDLFIGRYVKFDPEYRSYYAADNYPGPLDYEPETNVLLHNNCNGTFTDVSEKSGISRFKGRAMGATAADFDLDGYPDIYVANDKTENFLFHNRKDGTFEEIAESAGVAYGQSGENTSAMGPVFLDFDHDGRVDLWVSDSKYNRLMKNLGKLKFEDVTERAGISQLAAQYVSWGTGVHDFDNDGRDDIFVAHGGLIHMIPQEHSVFHNAGDWKFEDVSLSAGPFFETKSVARGAAFADYDNDGKIDVFIVNLGGPAFLLHNVSPNANHWISVKLVGHKSNRDGIGAQVEVLAGGSRQQHERTAGSGYLSQDDPRVHFGLGSATKVDKLTVTWPSGNRQALENVAADRVVTVEEK
ncbi:MAG TPA: CRTAC1 family protein [Candidatus Acidoferrales bacterium]|nr:CRTAC1 family protein [Candidatus Acidoferrales bacterium]